MKRAFIIKVIQYYNNMKNIDERLLQPGLLIHLHIPDHNKWNRQEMEVLLPSMFDLQDQQFRITEVKNWLTYGLLFYVSKLPDRFDGLWFTPSCAFTID